MNKVFVYGTLLKSHRNNRLLEGQTFIGKCKTLPKYRLYDVGSFPCMVKDDENGLAVEGEVYSVDDETKKRLDWLEGVASGLYFRDKVELEGITDTVEAYFWGRSPNGLRDIGAKWPSD